MKIKKGLDLSTSDFYYDLFEGGYLEPERICVHSEDATELNNAIVLIHEFKQSIEEKYKDFYN